MDQIDQNLLAAWNRIAALCRADPEEARRRAERQQRVTLQAPVRAWCLCLRASDTRLTSFNCIVERIPESERFPPSFADKWPTPDQLGGDWDGDPRTAIEYRQPHRLSIPGGVIRELTRPVMVPWPGEDWKRVAARCGVSKHYLRSWIRNGQVRVQTDVPAWSLAQRGTRVKIVYTPSPIDPNAFDARPPLALWGSLWQGMWESLPEQFMQTADRLPRYRLTNGRWLFRGWTWICPGRVGADAVHRNCGRTCNRLFGPLPPWTVPQALGDKLEVEAPELPGAPGADDAWSPGFSDPLSGRRSLACKACWGVRDISLIGPDGWNTFVTHATGGLLYGSEVDRPHDQAPEQRRRRRTKRNVRPAHRREQVRQLLLAGLSYREIAERVGFALATAYSTSYLVFRKEGVKTRQEFMSRFAKRSAQ